MRTEAPYAPPSIDPADNDTLTGMLRFVTTKVVQGLNNQLPAKVISYDRTKNQARVQPLIAIVDTNNVAISRAQISDVPVMIPGANNLCISFPVKAGDIGWLRASDRDISLFLQEYNESVPNTHRMFSFSDAVFEPDLMHGVVIDEDDADNLVIQKKDGTVKISIGANKIVVKAPTVEIQSSTEVKVTTPTLKVIGAITATGAITPNVPP